MATDGFSEIHKNCMTTQMVEVLSTSKPGWRQDQQRPRVVHPQTPQVETERNAHYSSRASSPNYAQYSSDAWIRFGAAGEAPRGRGAPRERRPARRISINLLEPAAAAGAGAAGVVEVAEDVIVITAISGACGEQALEVAGNSYRVDPI